MIFIMKQLLSSVLVYLLLFDIIILLTEEVPLLIEIVVLILALTMIFISLIHFRYMLKIKDIFHPYYIITLIYFLIFIFAPFIWIKSGKTDWYGVPVMDTIVESTLLFITGYIFFYIGYILFKPIKINTKIVMKNYNTQKALLLSRVLFWGSLFLVMLYFRSYGKDL